MFRRRPIRRMLRRATPIGEAGRIALRKANQLNEAGEYIQAAEIFERVAQRMENRLRPNRAAFLFLQAGHSRLLAGQVDPSMLLAKRSLNILAQNQHYRACTQGANLMIQELNHLGHPSQAAEIQTWMHQTVPNQADQLPSTRANFPSQESIRRLPAKCPYCGATLRSDMAEWIDALSAECPYCGSTVQAE
jgi:ribosomal protein S27AE